MNVELLHYRRWQGRVLRPAWSVWPIARVALAMLLRRKMFWVVYGFSLFVFLIFFFGGYLLDWAVAEMPENIKVNGVRLPTERWIIGFRKGIYFLNGSQATFAYFFRYQAVMVIVTLGLAGAVLVGNDFVHGSVPFYLSKPLSRWHYLLGKCLAVGVVVNMITTLPALVLFAQHGMSDWEYLTDPDYFYRTGTGEGPAGLPLLLGILGYGLLLTVVLSLMLVTVASWVRRTVPLIFVWTSIFLFCRPMSRILVDALQYDQRWRLIDQWNSLRLIGCTFLQVDSSRVRPQPQPNTWEAAIVLTLVCTVCLILFHLKTRAVEVVR